MANINDTAAVILANAAGRPDLKALPLPKGLRVNGAAATKVLDRLVRTGLLASIAATADDVAWAIDDEGGRTTLVATDEGLRAIGIEGEAPATVKKSTPKAKPAKKAATLARTRPTAAKSGKRGAKAAKTPAPAPKGLTKQQIVVGMLRRASGASIVEMMAATDWQAHSVRGFMSGALKKRLGLALVSEKAKAGERRYYVAPIK